MQAPPSNLTVIRRLLGLTWHYRWGCAKLLLLQAIMLLLAICTLRGVGYGIDLARFHVGAGPLPALPGNWHWPSGWSGWTQILATALAVLSFELVRAALHAYYIHSAGYWVHAQIVVDLRHRIYDKLQRLSFRFFDANATGSLINRVTSDAQAVRAFLDGVVIQLVILLMSLVFYLGYMLNIHAGLTLACLSTTPGLWVLTSYFSRRVRPQYDHNRELVDAMVLRLSENVQGAPVVKGFGREAEEIAKFNAANDAVRDQQRDIFWMVSVFTPLIGFLTQINLVILLAYGGWLVVNDQLSLGSGLVVFAGLLQQFSSQVANMTNLTNSIQQSLSGAQRVFQILDAEGEVSDAPTALPLARSRGDIQFDHVSFGYDANVPRLTDVSFHARHGECVAILGATGAGKSTLLSLVARFYDPQAGRIMLDGHDLRDWRLDDVRRNIGIVFQETFLFSNTVAANIAYGSPDATREQIEQAARIAAADEFIRQLPQGYDTVLGEAGLDLSGGQRQRIAIARAILLNPAILLLDDPAASVDAHTEEEILKAMDAAMSGRTTLLVAHRLSTLRRADRIIVLHEGRIVQFGRHDDLFDQPGHFRDTALAQLQSAAGVLEFEAK